MHTHIYTGDISTYAVTLASGVSRKGGVTVRIESVLSGEGTIPVGATVTVPARRVSAV